MEVYSVIKAQVVPALTLQSYDLGVDLPRLVFFFFASHSSR